VKIIEPFIKMIKFFKPLYFFLSFAIGLFMVYLFQPAPTVVVKFPSPYNAGKITYSKDDSCYKFKSTMVDCPENKEIIKPQPVDMM
jgi:hypothetical protein